MQFYGFISINPRFYRFKGSQMLIKWLVMAKAQYSVRFSQKPNKYGVKMSAANTPKINVRNSVMECAQSLKKENAGKYHNYGIKDCIVSIAATKAK